MSPLRPAIPGNPLIKKYLGKDQSLLNKPVDLPPVPGSPRLPGRPGFPEGPG